MGEKENPNINVFSFSDCLKLYIFNGSLPDGKTHRLVWCPYVEQQLVTDGDDENQMIAISHDTRVGITT